MIEEPMEEEVLEVEEFGEEEAVAAAEEQRQYSLAFEKINALIAECAEGVSDRKADALALADNWYALIDHVNKGFAEARAKRAKQAQEQPSATPPKDHGGALRFRAREAFSSPPTQSEVVVQPEPEPEPEPESAAISALLEELEAEEGEPKVSVKVPAEPKAARPVPDWAKVDWDEPEEDQARVAAAPVSVAGLALPGVAGEVQQQFLLTSMQPSEVMSLGVGLMVPTALVSGNVIGPSGPYGCALHQTLTVLAQTSAGKKYGIDFTNECVIAGGGEKLLGPNRFKSGAALVRHMKENRVQLCIQDEFGLLLAKLGNAKSNQSEIEINERMREFWSQVPGGVYVSPVGAAAGDDSVKIKDARLSIFGWGNRKEFFDACKGNDITNGFLNRIVVLEEPEVLRPRTIELVKFPGKLKEQLIELAKAAPQQIGWTPAARDIYEAEKDRVFNETNERKRDLWSRTPEKIVRAASTFAASRFALKADRSDMEVATAIMRMSDWIFKSGMDDAEKKRVLEHADLKLEIERRLRDDFSGAASLFEIRSSFRHNTKYKGAVAGALEDMIEGGILAAPEPVKTGGREKRVYRLV